MLKPQQSATLDDGSTVQFLGTQPWITISVRHDPGEGVVLTGVVTLMIGLVAMLAGRRRRIWFRITPVATNGNVDVSVVAAGGLARTP